MANVWADQPADAEGATLCHIVVDSRAIQVQRLKDGRYSVTVGNLFGSQTAIFVDAESAFLRLNHWANPPEPGMTS